jgi:predicted CxxxxCH...CXXCH cytochrome family protein
VVLPEMLSISLCSAMICHSSRNGILDASSKVAWLLGQSA